MKMNFIKMHGLGNDFVIINNIDNKLPLQHIPISELGNRHFGIGFDQLLVLEKAKDAAFFCRIFNADGSEAEQCGNGLRCVARYVLDEGLIKNSEFSIATLAGTFPVKVNSERVEIFLGIPQILNKALNLPISKPEIIATIVALGNPHAIINLDEIEQFDITKTGAAISTHPYFNKGINVGFMQILNNECIQLRTYERGSGETFACGSNACAAVAAGISLGLLNSTVQVKFKHGELQINWPKLDAPIQMCGETKYVFSGTVEI